MPPGPIDNSALVSGAQIARGLELNKQYVAVSKEVWTIFHRTYGGGPIIVRETEDIYSPDLAAEITARRVSKQALGKRTNSNIFAASSTKSQIQGKQVKKRNLF